MDIDLELYTEKPQKFQLNFAGTLGCTANMRIRIGDRLFVSSDFYWYDELYSMREEIESVITGNEGYIYFVASPCAIDYMPYFSNVPGILDKNKDYLRVWVYSDNREMNLEGVCEKRQFVGTLYQGLMEILLKDEDEVDDLIREYNWIESYRIPLYGRMKSRRIEQYAFDASKELTTKPLGWIQVKSGRKGLYQDHFGMYSNDLPGLLVNPSLIDRNAAETILHSLDDWWNRNIVQTGESWDNYLKEGEELCKKLRIYLSPSIDLWYFNQFIPVL